jgi:hypothetical protein
VSDHSKRKLKLSPSIPLKYAYIYISQGTFLITITVSLEIPTAVILVEGQTTIQLTIKNTQNLTLLLQALAIHQLPTALRSCQRNETATVFFSFLLWFGGCTLLYIGQKYSNQILRCICGSTPTDGRTNPNLERYGKRESTRIGREEVKGKEKPFTTALHHINKQSVHYFIYSLHCEERRVIQARLYFTYKRLIGDEEARKRESSLIFKHQQVSPSPTPNLFLFFFIHTNSYLNQNEYSYCNGSFACTSR